MYPYIQKFWQHIQELFTSFWGIIIVGINLFLAPAGVKSGLIALGVVFMIDFFTGLSASYKEYRKDKSELSAPYFLQSKKLRHSILKACTYFVFIIMSWIMWRLFFNGEIPMPLSDKAINIIEAAFGLCIAVECWSIIENIKRLGFDLFGEILKAIKGFRSTGKELKGDE